MTTNRTNMILAVIPLLFPLWYLIPLLDHPVPILGRWLRILVHRLPEDAPKIPPVGSQLLAYVAVALLGYVATLKLIPNIKQYTLRKGICGKDLGKRGTSIADKDM